MPHWKAYREGKITLRQARHLSGLKLSGKIRKYKKEEKRLGIK